MRLYNTQSSSQKPDASLRLADRAFRALILVGVLEITALVAALMLRPDLPPLVDQGILIRIWIGLVVGPALLSVGGLITWNVPGNTVGRILVLIALGAIAAQLGFRMKTPALTALVVETVILFDFGLTAPSLGYLMYIFPTGQIHPPPLKRPLIAAGIIKFAGVLLEILATPDRIRFLPLTTNPLYFAPLAPYRSIIAPTIGIAGVLLPMIILSGMISLVLRYHASAPVERQQIRWVIWGLTLLIPSGMTALAFALVYDFSYIGFQVAFGFAAIGQTIFLGAITIGILRYHLFNIDILINRTLVYSSLSLIIAGIYVVAVGFVSELFHASGSLILSLLATGLIAVLFQPLRERLQRGINRLMYGERDNPYAMLSGFGQRLESTLVPQAILPTIVETVAHGLKLPYVAIRLKQDTEFRTASSIGEVPTDENLVVLPLVYQAEVIGQMILAPRTPGDPLSAADHHLLKDLLPQIAVAVHVVRLSEDLQRSRERLVTAREEERRRLRRDLHDGIGPALATQSLKLEAAYDLALTDPGRSASLLKTLIEECQTIIADLRQVVYALRPPALDELGLISALREHCAQYNHSGVRILLQVNEELPALPAAAEVAVYRIAQEALTNVIRHAKAQVCQVSLSIKDESLHLCIEDNGCGFPIDRQTGVGLTSMRERAEELSGVCIVKTQPGGGTRIIVRLPLRSTERHTILDEWS